MTIFGRKSQAGKDRSLGVFHVEAAADSVENAGCAYQAPSVIAAGAEPQVVALLTSVTHLILSFLLIKVPNLIEVQKTSLKRTAVIVSTVNAISYLPLVLAYVIFSRISPLTLTGLWILTLVPSILVAPLRDSWLSHLVPGEKMGRYLSWRSIVSSVLYLGAFYLMGFILQITHEQTARGYAMVIALTFLASTISTVILWTIQPPMVPKPIKHSGPGFFEFLKDSSKNHLGVFILFVSMFTFCVNLAGPLFATYMLNDLQFSYMTYTVVISCERIARIFSLAFWGKRIDKAGSLKVLNISAYLIPLVPLFWLFSRNMVYLAAAEFFSGIVWAGFDLSVQTFIYKASKPEQRIRYIVYYKSLNSFSVALGAMVGALALSHVIPIFGSHILGVFLLSGVLRLVIARVMLPKLTLKGIPEASIHEELALELNAVKAPVFPGGLYYHPEVWTRFTKRALIIGNSIGKTFGKFTPSRIGLYYNPHKSLQHQKQVAAPVPVNTGIPRKGLYYKPADWAYYSALPLNDVAPAAVNATRTASGILHDKQAIAEYLAKTARVQSAAPDSSSIPTKAGLYYNAEQRVQQHGVAEKAQKVTIQHDKGIFHDPEKWKDYMQRSMVLDATTIQTSSKGFISRQPVYYHPEIWERLNRDTASAAKVIRNHTAHEKLARKRPAVYHQSHVTVPAAKTRPVWQKETPAPYRRFRTAMSPA